MSDRSTSGGGVAAERRLAQLGREPGEAEPRVHLFLRRARPEAARAKRRTPRSRSRERAPSRSRPARAATSSTGIPSTVTPSARRSSCSSTATTAGCARKRSTGSGVCETRTSRCDELAPAPQLAGRDSRRAEPRSRRPARVRGSGSGHARAGCGSRDSAARIFASVAGPTPGASRSLPASAAARSSATVRMPSAGRADEPLRAEAEVAAERDELRLDLALELRELCDPPRLDELAQARLDARADAAQLAHPARCGRAPRQVPASSG